MALNPADLSRAETIVPRPSFRGTGFEDTANTLSALLGDSLGFTTKPCADFGLDELDDLYAAVLQSVNPAFDKVYEAQADPRTLRVKDISSFESHVEGERRHLAAVGDADLTSVVRDGKCAELAMMLTHHLEADAREELAALFSVPELSAEKHAFTSDASPAHQAIHTRYQEQATCAICHEDQADTSNPLNAPQSWGQAHVAYQEEGGFGVDGEPAEVRYSNRWYNWDLKALREETLDPDTGAVTFGYVHIGPTMYLYQPRFSFCSAAPIGWAPVSPDWLQANDSLFLGNETITYPDGREFFTERWNRPDPISGDDHEMWVDIETGRPAKMEAEAPGGVVSNKLYLDYEELRPTDPRVGADIFAPPAYCDAASVSRNEEDIERLKQLIFRYKYW
jgi:hypothetical protein